MSHRRLACDDVKGENVSDGGGGGSFGCGVRVVENTFITYIIDHIHNIYYLPLHVFILKRQAVAVGYSGCYRPAFLPIGLRLDQYCTAYRLLSRSRRRRSGTQH